jgi:hypothetical protein
MDMRLEEIKRRSHLSLALSIGIVKLRPVDVVA